MSIDTITCIPFIHELFMELRLVPHRQFLAHGIKTSFPVTYKEMVPTQLESTVDTSSSPAMDDGKTKPTCSDPAKTLGTMGNPLRSFPQLVALDGLPAPTAN